MVLDARDEADKQLSDSMEVDTLQHAHEALHVLAKIEEDSVISNAPAASEVSRGLSSAAQGSSPSSGASYETDDDECGEELGVDLAHLIADSMDRSIRELQRIKATKASAMKFTVKEERSTFDYDATQDLEGPEEKMEMDFFEYDEEEELPQTNGADNQSATVQHVKGRNGLDQILHNGFRYSYSQTLLRPGLNNAPGLVGTDPESGEVTLSGEHAHDTKSGKAGSFAMCNGYRMRSKHANARGELYWVCARQTRMNCSGSAKSGLDAVDLVEIRKHNHDVDDERLTRVKVRRGVRTTVHADDGGPQRKIIRRAKADALNRLESAESTANSDESVPKVDGTDSYQVDESLRTNGTSTSTATTSGSTRASKSNSIVTASRSLWNFKSREAMRNADVVLHLQETKLYAHKAVLSAISPVFDEALRQSVGLMAIHSVDPSGIAPHGLEAFLHSIYPNGSEPADIVLPQVTVLAHRYGIRPLLRKCRERVRNSSTLSRLDKLAVAVKITDVELEDQVIASLTKDDIPSSASVKRYPPAWRRTSGEAPREVRLIMNPAMISF